MLGWYQDDERGHMETVLVVYGIITAIVLVINLNRWGFAKDGLSTREKFRSLYNDHDREYHTILVANRAKSIYMSFIWPVYLVQVIKSDISKADAIQEKYREQALAKARREMEVANNKLIESWEKQFRSQ